MLTENNLHTYQKACVQHIIEHPYCGLFIEMGLGKTTTTLTAINYLMFDYVEIGSVLVIAPKRVAESVWQEEAEKWAHLKHLTFSKIIGNETERIAAFKKKANIHIISRDNIAWLCSYTGCNLPFDMVVIDELSSFKSYKSLRFKALKQARPTLKRVVGLTGTPAPNGLTDLWPQIYLMDRGARLEKTVSAYRNKYFKPDRMNGAVVFSYKPLADTEKLVHEKIADICISMKAEDYIKLPEKQEIFTKLKMPEDLKEQYKSFERDKVLELIALEEASDTTISVVNAAALSNKLLQFANGAMYDENRTVHAIHDIKLDALEDIIEAAVGEPVLIAWTYQFDRDRIMERFKKYKPRELKTAKDISDWNEGKIQLLLAHPASAGHGLNLQAGGHTVVWFGQTWSLELYQQFNARLHRQGQTKPVTIYHLVLDETHDIDVINALASKNKKQESLMSSIKAKIEKYKRFL